MNVYKRIYYSVGNLQNVQDATTATTATTAAAAAAAAAAAITATPPDRKVRLCPGGNEREGIL